MSRAAVAVLLVLAGCDKLFDLDRLQRGDAGVLGDGATDASDAQEIDAGACVPIGHDEDDDTVDDACDACPTVRDETDGDGNADGDALPDHCDPRPSTPGDKIGKVWYFVTAAEYAEFDTQGAAHNTVNDLVAMGGNAALTSHASFNPVAIEINFTGLQGTGAMSEIWIDNNSVVCRFFAAHCTTAATDKACAKINNELGTVFDALASTAQRMVMTENAALMCTVTSATTTALTVTTGALTNAPIVVATSSSGQTSVKNIVVYTAP